MSTQLFAVIRGDSKYAYQNPPEPHLPFPVEIANTRDAYRVLGNGDQYRLEDVHLYVRAGITWRCINEDS